MVFWNFQKRSILMLNELCQLADALENARIAPREWHPKLKPLPKADNKRPCYKISITEGLKVSSITMIDPELVQRLRKWEPSNGNSFPGFNIQPLYRIT